MIFYTFTRLRLVNGHNNVLFHNYLYNIAIFYSFSKVTDCLTLTKFYGHTDTILCKIPVFQQSSTLTFLYDRIHLIVNKLLLVLFCVWALLLTNVRSKRSDQDVSEWRTLLCFGNTQGDSTKIWNWQPIARNCWRHRGRHTHKETGDLEGSFEQLKLIQQEKPGYWPEHAFDGLVDDYANTATSSASDYYESCQR